MADIFDEVEEDLRRDKLNRQWQKYGKFVIAGLVCFVIGTGAVVGWKAYRVSQLTEYSDRFAAALALVQEKKDTDAINALEALAQDASIGYATLARFREAALKAQDGDRGAAAAIYDDIGKDGSVDPLYAGLANLYYVLYELETADPDAMAARLEPLMADGNAWRHSARELAALIALRKGDAEKALSDYTALADNPKTPVGIRGRAAEMLRALKR